MCDFIVLGVNSVYFVKKNSKSSSINTEKDVVKMLECFIENIFVQCGNVLFNVFSTDSHHSNENKCAPLLAVIAL